MRFPAIIAILLVLSLAPFTSAQELVLNGDFETVAMSGTPPMPTLDAFGNANPTSWFRSGGPDPNRPTVPLTELIGPVNSDPADDSNGVGDNSAAMNSASINAHSDWRSAGFETIPGEELFWSFDFKFLNYAYTPSLNLPEGFRIELRSFDGGTAGGSTAGTFAGEQTVYVYVHGYGVDTDADGIGDSGGYVTGGSAPHPTASVTVADFNDGQWHTLNSEQFGDQDAADSNNLWRIPASPPNAANGLFSDVRVSINAFNTVFTDQMQLRVDNISVIRPVAAVLGDYNADGVVDAADYVLWRNGGPLQNEVASVGSVTEEDYTEWRARFGNVSGAGASLDGATAVPEPDCLALGLVCLWLVRTRRSLLFAIKVAT
jgi:hypothetical protein